MKGESGGWLSLDKLSSADSPLGGRSEGVGGPPKNASITLFSAEVRPLCGKIPEPPDPMNHVNID